MTHSATIKQEVFGVIWTDLALGPMALNKPTATSAVALAQSMANRGINKVSGVRAVHVPARSDTLTTLWTTQE